MYYDLCPWQSCGCPFCVEVPTNTNTMKPLLTTSTMFPRQEEEPTTTTEAAYYYEEETTSTPAYYYEEETTTPAPETTTETTTELMEEDTTTEEPIPEDPVTTPPRKTTARPRTTTVISSKQQTCTICICNTWSQRIHRWNPPPRKLNRFTDDSCMFCGRSWISSSFSRSQGLSTRRTRNTFNRRSGFLMGRWGSFSHRGGRGNGHGRGGQSDKWQYPQELPYSRVQRSFNRRGLFGNSFLFG